MIDRTAELEARIAALEERLARSERTPAAAMDKAVNAVLPGDTRRHIRAAWREQLLAVRSVLDHWIDAQEPGPEERARESIRVE
jgi:uncharacterized coiled-coil protein SlyX